MTFIFILIGLLIGGGIASAILVPKVKKRIKYDNATLKLNQDLADANQALSKKNLELNKNISTLEQTNTSLYDEKHDIETSIESIKAKREEMLHGFDLIKQQGEENAKEYKKNQIKIAKEQADKEVDRIQEELDETLQKIAENCQQNIEDYQETYLNILNDASEEVQNYLQQIAESKKQLEDIQNKVAIAIELEKTRQADKLLEVKYKVSLSEEDLIEIKRLREVAPFLRNARPVYKIIWEGYYRNPTNDLITRVIGNKNITGIYILTNTTNNCQYVGQAVNISDRWKQHIKCGLGIDTPNNVLYQAMKQSGVENFKFELVEECKREELNEKEKYWINFYKTDIYGYNMTKGGS